MLYRHVVLLCAVLLYTSGCSNPDRDHMEILQTLSTRATALNTRDLELYRSIVSPHYSDNGRNFIQLVESQKNNFKKFEQISYEAGKPIITVKNSSAEAVGTYRMRVVVQEKEVTLHGTEHLILAKEPEGWKIIAGI